MIPESSSLIIDVRPGEQLLLAGEQCVQVELIQKSGRLARLRVTAPRDVKIEKVADSRTVHGNLKTL